MKIDSVSLPMTNKLANDYLLGKQDALRFFQYSPFQRESYRSRLQWLQNNPHQHRDQLVDGLLTYNKKIGNHPLALERIEKLRQQDTYVVVAGQQAGILTGPLYTIHKAVHLIQSALKLQEELGVEVVPVYWIAGEDHDIDEINHLFWPTEEETKVTKEKLELSKRGRVSASQLLLDAQACERYVDTFFRDHTETIYTSTLRDLILQTAAEADTIVDWFVLLMARLFGKHGLVFVESSLPFVREMEVPVFRQLLERNEEITRLLAKTGETITQAGYQPQLHLDEKQANLFLYVGQDRLLLEREGGRFWTKNRRNSFTRKELLRMLETDPQRFSANVVSRPLMQEHLFPTLAFIGGPGEVAYWAFYKELFEQMGYQLPVVLPRLSITLVEGAIKRTLDQLDLPIETALTGFSEWKRDWQKQVEPNLLQERFAETRQAIQTLYQPVVEEVVHLDAGLRELADKNIDRLLEQISFLQDRAERAIREQQDVSLKRVQRVEAALIPQGAWQERKLSFFTFANKYGIDLLDQLVDAPFVLDGTHQVVYL